VFNSARFEVALSNKVAFFSNKATEKDEARYRIRMWVVFVLFVNSNWTTAAVTREAFADNRAVHESDLKQGKEVGIVANRQLRWMRLILLTLCPTPNIA
jgi:Na+/melibiose symporter-like transporter